MTLTRIPGTEPAHFITDVEALAADITDVEMVTSGNRQGHLAQERWVVDVSYVKPHRGDPYSVTVWSPCCGRPRQRIRHGYAFSCSVCGWWWRYHFLGWTNRFVSLGKEKPE